MEIINLNLIPTGTRPVVHASQYDNGRQFRANLFEGASVYTLTGAETLTFSVRKPDGHIVTEAVTNTSSSYVVIETTTQMCACAGDSFAELKIEQGTDLIGTLNLILAVEQSPEEGGDPSESFIHDLEQQIYDAVADQYDADSVIFDNTPTAGHGIGYTVTSEGILSAIPDELDDLSDVTTTTPSSGEALVWDGTKWTNTAINLDDITDVNVTGATDGQALCYDANGNEWVPVGVASYGTSLPMSTTEPTSMVADRITALESGKADIGDIPTRGDFIRYEDVTIGVVEFTQPYTTIPVAKRPTLSGFTFLYGFLVDYGSITAGTSGLINIDGTGTYLFGITGSKYSNVKVRYIYIKS